MGPLQLAREDPYFRSLAASPVLSAISFFLLVSIVTRIITGVRSNIAQDNNDARSKTPNRIAYWLPWLGSALSFVRDIEGTISRDLDSSGDDIFSNRMGSGQYNVVNMLSLVQQVFAQRGNVLNKQGTLEWPMKTAFDDKSTTRDEHEAFQGYRNALNLMLKEDLINEATGKTARAEEAGKVKFNADGTFEADFYNLIVNYMGQIVIDMLWGRALIKNHTNLQTVMWDFDEDVHHILTKYLANITAAGCRATAARERLTLAMREWHEAVAAKQAGRNHGAQ
ncbi:hypothetical protein FB567DRAFT_592369 [Paraphoma chrysanthemicola]|uniref:Uncharacterized protein n=1 Tax=Paraphoma chrysanthemicola TaxID=798071 RepID=A0A8K0R799_9PLEO|nr:hypothetical protein FB567DRAFT_592369 [Paraphoma chrysanthemicola]